MMKYKQGRLSRLNRMARNPGHAAVLYPNGLSIFLCAILFALSFSIKGMNIVHAESQHSREYAVKAAFLFNFATFSDWPGDAFTNGTSNFQVCILGKDPFGEAFDSFRGKTVKGKKVVVRRCEGVEETRDCQIIYISPSEKSNLLHILRYLKNRRVMTVGDQEGFCRAGGMVNMIQVRNRIGFEVNRTAANRSGLQMSSHLLKLATDIFE